MASSKTTRRKNHPNPIYNEKFFFQVASFQLDQVSLMISVYHYPSSAIRRKKLFGWISLGKNSSSECEEDHWREMCYVTSQQAQEEEGEVTRWHTLVDS